MRSQWLRREITVRTGPEAPAAAEDEPALVRASERGWLRSRSRVWSLVVAQWAGTPPTVLPRPRWWRMSEMLGESAAIWPWTPVCWEWLLVARSMRSTAAGECVDEEDEQEGSLERLGTSPAAPVPCPATTRSSPLGLKVLCCSAAAAQSIALPDLECLEPAPNRLLQSRFCRTQRKDWPGVANKRSCVTHSAECIPVASGNLVVGSYAVNSLPLSTRTRGSGCGGIHHCAAERIVLRLPEVPPVCDCWWWGGGLLALKEALRDGAPPRNPWCRPTRPGMPACS